VAFAVGAGGLRGGASGLLTRVEAYHGVFVYLMIGSPLCTKIRRRAAGKGNLGYSKNVEHYRMTENGEWELYDIKADPYQEQDLSAADPGIRDKMAAHYEAWWEEVSRHLARRAEQ